MHHWFIFLSHQQTSSLCNKLLASFTLRQQWLVGDCKIMKGSKRPLCSINYVSVAYLITWSTRLANEPWPDLLIIKMQSKPVACLLQWLDVTWCSHQQGCLLVTLQPNLLCRKTCKSKKKKPFNRNSLLLKSFTFNLLVKLGHSSCLLSTAFRTIRLLESLRAATISPNVKPGLWNLLTFLSVVSKALCISMREGPSTAWIIYILLQGPLTQSISWQNNNCFKN